MLKKTIPTIKALKLAPWWKRLLAYIIDNILLYILFTIIILGLYYTEFTQLFYNIFNSESFQLPTDVDFTKNQLEHLQRLSIHEQKSFYWIYSIQSKYRNSIFLLTQIISSIYFGLFWWGTGQTMGAKILKIKVISINSLKPSIFSVITRVIGLKLIEIGWGIPAIIVINPLFKQRIHDSLSHTVVVEELPEDTEEELLQNLDKETIEEIQSNSSNNEH